MRTHAENGRVEAMSMHAPALRSQRLRTAHVSRIGIGMAALRNAR